jgi:thymidylate synthase
MQQYLNLCNRILEEGVWEIHRRSGKKRLTVINADLEYDCSNGQIPVLTTKKTYWKPAIAEMLGYLRGYNYAWQFRDIGCNTWNANSNDNVAWLNNPERMGKDHMGRVYGVQGRRWLNYRGDTFDQLKSIYEKLGNGIDDGRLILTFHNPGELDLGCLPACMHTHTFSLVGKTLHLTSYQRSCDVPLGLPFNMIQTAFLLRIMAEITGNVAGKVYHKIVNAHIYDDQIQGIEEQVKRTPYPSPVLEINPEVGSLEYLEKQFSIESDLNLVGYEHHPGIKFAFTT